MEKLYLKIKPGLIVLLVMFVSFAQSQTIITGNVTSEDGGSALPGVSVLIKGTSVGTTTDVDGNYSLEAESAETLIFSFVGYVSEEIIVGNQSVINISLVPDITSLEEIVVVGYGTQKKSDITGSVASIPQERLQQVPNNNFAQAIQGAIPGISVVSNSAGAEGNDVSILIRGRNSMTASNSPLIVLDGMPYSGSISEINPTDIESIEVLKDASASAIYGSRGSNGVILITSKQGKQGKPMISYDGFYGIQKIASLPDLLSPAEFYEFKNTREPGSITNSEELLFQNGGGTDWLDLTTQNGYKQQHTLSVSGGAENIKYYISGSFLDVEGVAVNDLFKRYSTRFNLEVNITKWLKAGTNTQLSLADRSGLASSWSGGSDGAFYMNPLTSSHDENGDLTIYPWPEEVFWGNPLAPTLADNEDKSYKIFSNNYLNIDFPFVPGLSYKLNTGVEYTHRDRGTYFGRNTKTGLETGGRADTRTSRATNLVVENILNYQREIGKHSIFITGLYSYQEDEFTEDRLESQGFPNDVLTWYQANVGNLVEPSYEFRNFTILSSMIRVNYGYDNRYLLTFTGRRDGFSGFGANSKWGNFPSVALGWNIDQESFMPATGMLSTLKLRLSYGKNGNQAVSPYETLARLSERSYLDGGTTAPGYVPSQLGNPELGWESTGSFNLGIDYGFFEDRIQGSIDIYESNTDELLLEREISPVHGITEITQNIGKTKNRGLEFTVSANVIKSGDFSWDVSGNFSYMKNEIVELYGDGQDDVLNNWFIGQPIRVNYAFEFDGVFQEGEDIENSPLPDARPGDAKIVDQNGDGMIDADNDRTIIGQRDPKFISGLNMNFRYKSFTLNIFSHSAHGMTRVNSLMRDDVWADVRRNTIRKNWWTPDNPTNEFWANDLDTNPRGVRIYENAGFWRLKDVTLSYDLPTAMLEKFGFDRFKLYFTGRNLLTITEFEGLDPELNSDREIPLQQEFIFGLNLGF